uniref:Uncharacterized protein n=1 Tax=Trichuris muris TaxID=70415 RepID=A0A5S6QAR4_TRIMR
MKTFSFLSGKALQALFQINGIPRRKQAPVLLVGQRASAEGPPTNNEIRKLDRCDNAAEHARCCPLARGGDRLWKWRHVSVRNVADRLVVLPKVVIDPSG